MSITPLPTLDRTSATFRADVDTFFASQLPAFATQVNDAANRMDALAFGAYSGTSSTSMAIGTGSKTLTIETGKSFSVGQVVMIASTASPINYMSGQVTSYDSSTGSMTVNVTTSNGSSTLAAWTVSISSVIAGAAPTITQRSVTGADTLIASDHGKLVICSGTFSLSVTAAATLGNGWYCYVRNGGTGTVTLDPNGSETVDGVTSGPVRGTILLVCNGTGFTAEKLGGMTTTEVLTSGTSWTAPLGVRATRVRVQGGGGGGGRNSAADRPGTGGGGGGYVESIVSVSPGSSYTYAIGAAGDGATSDGAYGNNGGSTTLTVNGVTLTAGGGYGGAETPYVAQGGVATNGTLNVAGGAGFVGNSGQYGVSVGGNSMLGFGGARDTSCPPTGYGSGGYGTYTGTNGCSGKPGCIILEY